MIETDTQLGVPTASSDRAAVVDGIDCVGGALWRLTRRALQLLRVRAELRRGIAALSRADEHMLRDIGLTRDDIERVTRHGRF